jgi:hypothetical protein
MPTTTTRIYNTRKDVMVDIETLSTRPNAVIVSIGAIKFDRKGPLEKLEEMDSFYTKVSRESCEVLGMNVDPSTVEWWNRQDDAIRFEALENPEGRLPIKDALKNLATWIGTSQYIWGHGDDFDCVILGEAYNICNIKVPWKFWNTRDTRTLFDLAGIRNADLPKNDKHHPIHDCFRQVSGVSMSMVKLGLTNLE